MRLTRLLPLLIALSLQACTEGGGSDPDNDACSVLGLDSKIVNGTACEPADSPVVYVLAKTGPNSGSSCSGTLITPHHVLTAAHCFPEGYISVAAGNYTLTSQSAVARSVTIHPNASIDPLTSLFHYDVAIIELETPLPLQTLPLFVSRPVEPGDIVSIFGYGLDEDKGSGVLRSGQMEVENITPEFIVTDAQEDRSNVCFGDSGGPALFTGKRSDGSTITGVVGVTSAGSGLDDTCEKGEQSSFANAQATAIVDFIRDAAPGVSIQ